MALNIERAGARSRPSVMVELLIFSGFDMEIFATETLIVAQF
jgi:hypothetical protein